MDKFLGLIPIFNKVMESKRFAGLASILGGLGYLSIVNPPIMPFAVITGGVVTLAYVICETIRPTDKDAPKDGSEPKAE
jgi:hypothetical protein